MVPDPEMPHVTPLPRSVANVGSPMVNPKVGVHLKDGNRIASVALRQCCSNMVFSIYASKQSGVVRSRPNDLIWVKA
jgi:hypothetical protein